MPRWWQVCACLAGAFATAPPVAAQELTEEQIVQAALRESPRVLAIHAVLEAARAEQRARTARANPTLGYSREGAGFTEFLQVEHTIPLWGTRAALVRAGTAAVQAAEAERDASLSALRAEIRSLVAEFAAADAATRAAEAAIGDLLKLIDVLRTREREGEGSRFDRVRAERELSDARRLLAETRVRFTEARVRIQAHLPPSTHLARVSGRREVGTGEVPPLDALLTKARTGRPELIALQRARQRFVHEAEAARRARLPHPSVFGGVKRADAEERRETGGLLGVNLTLPLFDSGRLETARWTAERLRVEAEAAALERSIEADVARAAETLALRRQALTEYENTVLPESGGLRTIATTAYVEGALGILELIDALRSDWSARIQAIAMRQSLRLAEIDLDRAVGGASWP